MIGFISRVRAVSRHSLASLVAVEVLALIASVHQVYARSVVGMGGDWTFIGSGLILVVPLLLMSWYALSRRRGALWAYAVAQWTTIAGFGFYGPSLRHAMIQLSATLGEPQRFLLLLDSLAPDPFMRWSGAVMIAMAGVASIVSMRFYRENGMFQRGTHA